MRAGVKKQNRTEQDKKKNRTKRVNVNEVVVVFFLKLNTFVLDDVFDVFVWIPSPCCDIRRVSLQQCALLSSQINLITMETGCRCLSG